MRGRTTIAPILPGKEIRLCPARLFENFFAAWKAEEKLHRSESGDIAGDSPTRCQAMAMIQLQATRAPIDSAQPIAVSRPSWLVRPRLSAMIATSGGITP